MAEKTEMQLPFGRYILNIQLDDMAALEDLAHSKDNKVLCQLLLQLAEVVGSEMRDAVRAGDSVKAAGLEGKLDATESLILLLDEGLQQAFDDAKEK